MTNESQASENSNEANRSIPAAYFVEFGSAWCTLCRPKGMSNKEYASAIKRFCDAARKCGFPRSLIAAKPIFNNIERFANAKIGERVGLDQFAENIMQSVIETVLDEAESLHVLPIGKDEIPDCINHIADANIELTSPQSLLLNEVVACFHGQAYRSGIVAAWNLLYDFVRQWVFNNKLEELNEQLTKRSKNSSDADAIHEYSDFFTGKPSEYVLIDCCKKAQILSPVICDDMFRLLRQRNDLAHVSFLQPTVERTKAYVQVVTDIMVNPRFAKREEQPDSSNGSN